MGKVLAGGLGETEVAMHAWVEVRGEVDLGADLRLLVRVSPAAVGSLVTVRNGENVTVLLRVVAILEDGTLRCERM